MACMTKRSPVRPHNRFNNLGNDCLKNIKRKKVLKLMNHMLRDGGYDFRSEGKTLLSQSDFFSFNGFNNYRNHSGDDVQDWHFVPDLTIVTHGETTLLFSDDYLEHAGECVGNNQLNLITLNRSNSELLGAQEEVGDSLGNKWKHIPDNRSKLLSVLKWKRHGYVLTDSFTGLSTIAWGLVHHLREVSVGLRLTPLRKLSVLLAPLREVLSKKWRLMHRELMAKMHLVLREWEVSTRHGVIAGLHIVAADKFAICFQLIWNHVVHIVVEGCFKLSVHSFSPLICCIWCICGKASLRLHHLKVVQYFVYDSVDQALLVQLLT